MKLTKSLLASQLVYAQDCDLAEDPRQYDLYGCVVKRDGLGHPGDSGTAVFDGAKCHRAVCRTDNGSRFYAPECKNGTFSLPNDFCLLPSEQMDEGIAPVLGERLSTSGASGSSHITDATQQQLEPDAYPEKLIIFGSYTPGKWDTDSFMGQGVYKKYTGNDVSTRFTDRKPIYQHIEDDDLFFSFSAKTKEWRITKKRSIAKATSYCNFKAFYGVLHDPTNFSSWTTRKCFVKGKWVDTDLTIIAASDKLQVRQRLCPRDFAGAQYNAFSEGQLKLEIQGATWKHDVKLPSVMESAPNTFVVPGFRHSYNDIVNIDASFLDEDALCLSELSISQGDQAINLLHLLKKKAKVQKWSLSWMVTWWDGNNEDPAWPHGTVALVNPLVPNKLEDITHHYYKFVDRFREFIIPNVVESINKKPEGQNTVIIKPIEKPTQKPKPKPPSVSTGSSVLHCDVAELESKFGLHFGNCKLPRSKKSKISNSRTNQARFDSKVVDGSVCQMKCAKYPKPPFKAPKMECKCGTNSRFKIYSNLQSLLQNGPSVSQLLFKSCHWYNLSNKKSTTPVMPINVFGIVECPAGCSSKLINTQQHTCGPLTQFNKTCLLTCPGAKKPVKAKCVVDKRTKRPKFTKLCKPQG